MTDFLNGFRESIKEIELFGFAIILGMALVMFVTAVSAAFKYLVKARTLEDVPTSKARSAEQGYVELEGHAELLKGDPIIAPLTRSECVWWSYTVEQQRGDDWSTIKKDSSDALFGLRDATGLCVVDPEGADVFPEHRRRWKSREKLFTTPGKMRRLFEDLSGSYRYTETMILEHEWICVIGNFKTHSAIDHWDDTYELSAILSEWKKNQPELLARFDKNDDGVIDQDEWELARAEARKYIDNEKHKLSIQPGVNVIGAPADKRPFLIAPLNNSHFAKALRKKATVSCAAMACATLYLLFVLHARFIF